MVLTKLAMEVLMKEAYITILEMEEFAPARDTLKGLLNFLVSKEVRQMEHGELEERLRTEGDCLLKGLYQATLDLFAKNEPKLKSVTGSDEIERNHRRTRERGLMTIFGEVEVNRMAYGKPGEQSLFPLDGQLNLPPDLFSHGMRRRVAQEVIRGSYDEGLASIERTTGGKIHKLQAEQLMVKIAQDFDSFYSTRAAKNPEDTTDPLALSLDGKGIVMRKDALREPTKAAAERAEQRPKGAKLGKGEKRGRKRMATVGAVWTAIPHVRTAESILGTDQEESTSTTNWARNKRVFASVEKEARRVCEEVFQEGLRRDPAKRRPWCVLVDGAEAQLDNIEHCIEKYEVEDVTVIIDIIHVIEYIWGASYCFNAEGSEEARTWVRERLLRILQGQAIDVAAKMKQSATKRKLSKKKRAAVDKCANYLHKYSEMLRYDEYLKRGLPIATGVIEGACRHLVKDRMDITGARWALQGAEAILRLRSLQASGDLDAYLDFHKKKELDRNHLERFRDFPSSKAA